LRWTYSDFTYAGGHTYRKVASRQLVKQAGAAPVSYTFARPSGDSALRMRGSGSAGVAVSYGGWLSDRAGVVVLQRQMPGGVVKAQRRRR
jgi:hypothetical protein